VTAPLISDLELERIAALGWQAEHTAWLGGWLLRANGGFTGRANSVLPLSAPGLDLDDALREVGQWYARRGLPTRVAVPSPACAELDAALIERGWAPAWGAVVLTAGLDDLAVRDEVEVDVAPAITPAWESAYHYRGESRPAGRGLLERADVVGFAQVVEGGQVVGIARGTVVEHWLGITAVEVAPRHRRQGMATRLLAGLVAWSRRHGAAAAYLQVAPENEGALSLYRGAGFVDHHTYRYLDAPGRPH
jgi:N-acetylglutamate synthase